MISRLLSYTPIQFTLSLLIILGAIFCVFTPNYLLFKQGELYAVQIMLGYMALGMIFLVAKQPRLVFTSFTCCAALCMFLKHSANGALKFPAKTNEATVSVAHFNLSNADHDLVNEVLKTNADIISFQEVNPIWKKELEKLSKHYPNNYVIADMDFGMAVYSRYQFEKIDTFLFNNIPNITGSIKAEGTKAEVHFISSYTKPLFYLKDYEQLKNHLQSITDHATELNAPLITMGGYNAVPWSNEILSFREAVNLNDSRRGFVPRFPNFFQIPFDHIFYSEHLQCFNFNSIDNAASEYVGIMGIYQFRSDYPYDQKTIK